MLSYLEKLHRYKYHPISIMIYCGLGYLIKRFLVNEIGLNLSKPQLLLFYGVIVLISVLMWAIMFYYMPGSKKGRLGIVIAVTSESPKQGLRIKKDLCGKLEQLISEHNLSNCCNLVILNDHQSTRLKQMIKKKLELKPNKTNIHDKLFRFLTKNRRYKAIVYGEIKERVEEINNYVVESHTIVMLETMVSQRLADMYSQVISGFWKPKIVIPEKNELTGFPMVGDFLFVCSIFIIGSVLPISGQLSKSIELLESVRHSHILDDNEFINKNRAMWDNLFKSFLMRTYLTLARQAYFDGNYEKAHTSVVKSTEVHPDYDALLLRAITEFRYLNDPRKALATVIEAGSLGTDRKEWKYSKAFLLMHLGMLDDAYYIYNKLVKNPNPADIDMVKSIYSFIEDHVDKSPERTEFHFVLGFLKYKLNGGFEEAMRHFEVFMAYSDKCPSNLLQRRGKIYLDELKRLIK